MMIKIPKLLTSPAGVSYLTPMVARGEYPCLQTPPSLSLKDWLRNVYIDGLQMSVKCSISEEKCLIKRQLYSGPFTLRGGAFSTNGKGLSSLYLAQTECIPCFLPSRSEATPHENHLHVRLYTVILTYLMYIHGQMTHMKIHNVRCIYNMYIHGHMTYMHIYMAI